MIWIWLGGLLRRRSGRLLATAGGVAVAVALVASLGSFLAAAQASMTARAAAGVAVDWQVELSKGADTNSALATIKAAPGVKKALPVGYAPTTGLQAVTAGSTQRTGPGVILGLPSGYAQTFPGQIRSLTGSPNGVLVAQQTASNLHIGPGDSLTIQLAGSQSVRVTVDGVVDLPQANSLFQTVGAPPQSQPTAPPDNVVLLPAARFDHIRSALSAPHPDLLSTQIHVMRSHQLPPAPADSFVAVTAAAHNLEASLAGAGTVGDNLAAALDAARSDAGYSNVLFLFLGLPGAVLAGILTISLARAGTVRRRREQAILRTRGATASQVVRVAVLEAGLVGVAGGLIGLGGAAILGALIFGTAGFGASTLSAIAWPLGAFAGGLAIAGIAVVGPAVGDFRASTVASARRQLGRVRNPWWSRFGLDLIALMVAFVVFLVMTQKGYTLVLAPEGVASIWVNYWAFLGPALLWIGAGLLTWRLTNFVLRRRAIVATLIRPLAGSLGPTAAASMSRQRSLMSQSVVVLALALAFAASTATFNATYQQQAEVDARLTNGADVTATAPPSAALGAHERSAVSAVPGVIAVEPLAHRFAYVGADLQDIYGIHPQTITHATSLQDAYFQGGTAAQMMDRLAASPDAVLVSAETVKDFQLKLGDHLTLRVQDTTTKQFKPVQFHYAGIVSEFPTAPKDSFFVANADYLAQQTHNSTANILLINTGGQNVASVTAAVSAKLGSSAAVTGIDSARSSVGSSLTSVDLAGLTRVELSFALLLACSAGGLLISLGLVERRRTFAIATVLGATRRQLRGMILSEGATITVAGAAAGAVSGWALTQMLIAVLTGVFDPPPAHAAVPGGYLALVLALAAGSILAADLLAFRARRPAVEILREP
ncbi:ABC transporter permease [Paenarthrobacter sp. Z7-10]|uniref:FtsX-like permease family protein n=1 Tax=Paenarthrobacter sp. Z7-10 TaxID=2787635 RepID=UPI0022A90A0F|nr:FtsX-like permease family protein [Paenarthrobacter sp. Z7-10]MCZ2403983.1 ABC transporter permease [Paenarthrobacter sp. Z7-10]